MRHIALNRPGPLANKLGEFYIKERFPPELDLPALKEITRSTRYVLIYQEQIIETAQVARLSAPEGRRLRRPWARRSKKKWKS